MKSKFRLKTVDYPVIGIDPDTKKNGVCLYKDGQITLHSFYREELIQFIKDNPNCVVVLENPSANKPVFQRKGQSVRAMSKIAQNVGAVKEVGRIIEYELQKLKTEGVIKQVVLAPPLKNYFKNWKKDEAMFRNDTGIQKSNADKRDAAGLVYNFLTH